ncbi:MAG: nucleoside-diphosphate kinase [Candidatus Krumholzibacteria bacterium]
MKTLLMVKPDLVEEGLHGEIIAFVLRNRFNINRLRMLKMDRETAGRFYDVHKDREFYTALVDYMTSGRVVAMEVEGEGVIERIRAFIGPTDPAEAAPGTVRYMYGKSIQNNAVHASDSPASAKKELAIVFEHS